MELTHTVVITIGRNIGNIPMMPTSWGRFKQEVSKLIAFYGGVVLQRPALRGTADQIGEWEGTAEDAATFVALLAGGHNRVAGLRGRLADTAAYYDQDAIGFIAVEGTDHLVTPAG